MLLRNVERTDIDLGGGPDHARMLWKTGYVGFGVIGGGAGRDIISAVAQEALFVDLEDTRMDVNGILGGRFTVTGFENVDADSPFTLLWGDRDDNELWGTGCRVRVLGGRGSDVVHLARPDGRPGRSCDGPTWFAYGQRGDDRLVGGADNDVLLGRAGRDRANGGKGDDRCETEVRKACER